MSPTSARRSKLLDASQRYWDWYGRTLTAWATSGRRRTHRFFVFGGCLAWLVFLFAFFLFAVLAVSFALLALTALTLVGVLLSTIGGVDQLRLAVTP